MKFIQHFAIVIFTFMVIDISYSLNISRNHSKKIQASIQKAKLKSKPLNEFLNGFLSKFENKQEGIDKKRTLEQNCASLNTNCKDWCGIKKWVSTALLVKGDTFICECSHKLGFSKGSTFPWKETEEKVTEEKLKEAKDDNDWIEIEAKKKEEGSSIGNWISDKVEKVSNFFGSNIDKSVSSEKLSNSWVNFINNEFPKFFDTKNQDEQEEMRSKKSELEKEVPKLNKSCKEWCGVSKWIETGLDLDGDIFVCLCKGKNGTSKNYGKWETITVSESDVIKAKKEKGWKTIAEKNGTK